MRLRRDHSICDDASQAISQGTYVCLIALTSSRRWRPTPSVGASATGLRSDQRAASGRPRATWRESNYIIRPC